MDVLFYIAAAVALATTLRVITASNAVHGLLYLIVSLLSVALIFFMLGAPFVAALEVIIYAGAIMVLFIFVMMMLNLGQRSADQEKRWLSPGVYVGPAFLSLILAACFVYMLTRGEATPAGYEAISPQQLGLSMFSTYLLGVELAGMLLLAALVGAYHLARSDQHEDPPSVKRTARKHEEAGSLE